MSHLGGIGEEGRSRGEEGGGRLTKETSCCLHTNPKLIMSRGAGEGQGNVLAGVCPESWCPSLHQPPLWALTTHTTHPSARTAAGKGRKGPLSPRLKSSPSGCAHLESRPGEDYKKGQSL